ncbi:MAG: hypothetical protein JW910_04080 [Anaerolineae bacterium]|nr:hypothetical protein [Anaerolineae bacterium]
MTDPARIALDSRLTRVLSFTARDLAANREAYLSKAQRERIFRQARWATWGWAIFAACMAWAGLPFLLNLLTATPECSALCGSMIFLPVAAGAAYGSWRTWRNMRADLHKGTVASAAGRARLEIEEVGQSVAYRLHIGRIRFRVEEDVLLAFRQDGYYRVYFVPHTAVLLSAELITPDDVDGDGPGEDGR